MSDKLALNTYEAALEYVNRGLSPIPVPFKQKGPQTVRWQNLRLEKADISKYFGQNPLNVGVLNGEPSGGLIDVDLDAPEAVMLASYFLPDTGSIFGRESKRQSHRLYIAEPPGSTKTFQDVDGAMLVEYRSTGSQTIFPGSVHPLGS